MVTLGRFKTNRIYTGDNVELSYHLPNECIDLIVTSPPYDCLRDYGGHAWDFEKLARQLYRVIKPGGVLVWIVNDATIDGNETGTSFNQAIHFKSLGFSLFDTMIYQPLGTGAKGNTNAYWQAFEFMFVFSKGTPKTINLICDRVNSQAGTTTSGQRLRPDGQKRTSHLREIPKHSKRTNIWQYTNDRVGDHPAPFPSGLARDHIISWSSPGDVVLDPFAGRGTTLEQGIILGREILGFEINPDYTAIAKCIIHDALLQPTLFTHQELEPKTVQEKLFNEPA